MTEGERRLNAAITDPQYYINTTDHSVAR